MAGRSLRRPNWSATSRVLLRLAWAPMAIARLPKGLRGLGWLAAIGALANSARSEGSSRSRLR